ncbi:hypothetical protein J5S49_01860 [Virgibacillus halodenitrificans]|uniref:hypothetical protein n=1 Tax=Virgibacillus halodenitrificans TaxID=1482 RepID=UPI001F26D77E|nr:hypothetical protein [Virgibacillus halodenitrificans]MCG1027034.1 hypothetical protein [Virgibacillus halodenitrificans]
MQQSLINLKAKKRKLNLIEVGIIEYLEKNRGRLLTLDHLSKDPAEQNYIRMYIDGLAEEGFIEKVGDRYRAVRW